MVMEEHEIMFSYNNAADQKKQVQILAETNDVDVWTMATWLKEHGAVINLQNFQKFNPAWIASTVNGQKKAKAQEKQDGPTKEQYDEALREAEVLRERNDELHKQICELTRELAEMKKPDTKAAGTTAAAEPERTVLTDAQKLHITKILCKTYYESGINDAVTYLDILDAIINEEEDA